MTCRLFEDAQSDERDERLRVYYAAEIRQNRCHAKMPPLFICRCRNMLIRAILLFTFDAWFYHFTTFHLFDAIRQKTDAEDDYEARYAR